MKRSSLVGLRSVAIEEARECDSVNLTNDDGDIDTLPYQARAPSRVLQLKKSSSTLLFTILYILLSLFAWVVLCLLTYNPISTRSYGSQFDRWGSYGTGNALGTYSLYLPTEKWFRAARVIQFIVAILTIPVVSAICSRAAVVHTQQNSRLTLRQMMAFADRGWQSPIMAGHLVTAFKRYASKLLLLAIGLNLLGGIILPLQSIFMSVKTIKTPTWPQTIYSLTDIYDLLDSRFGATDWGTVPSKARALMASTTYGESYGQLWTGEEISCGLVTPDGQSKAPTKSCRTGGAKFGDMSALPDPFLAQLPAGFSTGLVRQFMLRINSTASRQNISDTEFPQSCDTLPGSFYARYSGASINPPESGNWSLTACMPANQTYSPWKATRKRQDFYEELYLNISLYGYQLTSPSRPETMGGLFRIRVDTTAGFFELPNYMNELKPGPLLSDGPTECGHDCARQGDQDSIQQFSKRADNVTVISNTSVDLESSHNRGPLLTTAIALFGHGSFLATRQFRPESYIVNQSSDRTSGICVEQVPFIPLLRNDNNRPRINTRLDPCIRAGDANGAVGLDKQMVAFVNSLIWNSNDGYAGGRIVNAFTVAAFLSNQAWLMSAISPSFEVTFDLGTDLVVPTIDYPWIIVISVLLGIFLAALLALAVYGACYPVWTNELDSFAMLRIGASLAGQLALKLGDAEKSKVLDATPGSIGDGTSGEGEIGELALGAKSPLIKRRKFSAL